MPAETVRSRFRKVLSGQRPTDRLPIMEWAMWWDLTIKRWRTEGLPSEPNCDIKEWFGLDVDYQLWMPPWQKPAPTPKFAEPRIYIENHADYDALLPRLYPDPIPFDRDQWRARAARQATGEAAVWITLDGFFWGPRRLLGVEPHLYAFYDQPDLLHRINQDQVRYMHRCLDVFCKEICTPDFMTFGEDMSYNHGPMIGKEQFYEFLTPYYRQITPRLRELGITPLIDSDGGVEPLIPWFEEAGLEGTLPLERMAGVDVSRIRQGHPQWKMIGGFDKLVMHHGEEAMRQEFERLLPAMRSGYFIPSVDHQTPPAVSLEQYRVYLRLLGEYAVKAVRD